MTHGRCNQAREVPEGSHDESIDLSAGFVLKNTPASGEPASAELTPDSFMAQQGMMSTYRH